jgi:hypothetical protein
VAKPSKDRLQWNEAIKAATKAIPDTWLDPLLTGPENVLPRTDTFTPKDVERLLHAVRARVRGLMKLTEDSPKKDPAP